MLRNNDLYAYTGQANEDVAESVNGLNQLVQQGAASLTYDAAGNLAGDETDTYLYDVENRLVARSGGGSAALRYDPLGRLYEVAGGALGTQRFLHDSDALVAEYAGTGAMLRRYVHGPSARPDDPLLWYEGPAVSAGARRYLYADPRGSIVLSTDAAGGAAQINAYDAYGIPDDASPAGLAAKGRFRYTGQMLVPEAGLYHYKARMYAPALGRFLQPDPIGYQGGMNLYAYVGGDPVNRIDPWGMQARCVGLEGYPLDCGGFENEGGTSRLRVAPVNPRGRGPRAMDEGDADRLPESGKDDPPPCDALQRGLQKLGRYGVKLGGDVTATGLVITGGGVAIAGASASTIVLAPGGVALGGSIATGGANVTLGGGVITTVGALSMLFGGSGKEAVADLAGRVVSSKIPGGFGKDLVGNAVQSAVNALPFEFRTCR